MFFLLIRKGLQLGQVTRGGGKDLGHVHTNDKLRIEAAHFGGDNRTPIHALRSVAIIA